jgi:hypothetical protein
MAMIRVAESAAADYAAGEDMLRNSVHQISTKARRVPSIALVGSNAAGDAEVALYFGEREIVSGIVNSSTGLNATKDDFLFLPAGKGSDYLKPGEKLSVKVVTASNTSPMAVIVNTQDLPKYRKKPYRKSYRKFRRYFF